MKTPLRAKRTTRRLLKLHSVADVDDWTNRKSFIKRLVQNPKTSYPSMFSFQATGLLLIRGRCGFATARAIARDGQIPEVVQIDAGRKMIALASGRNSVWLHIFGRRLKVPVVGRRTCAGVTILLVSSWPLYTAMAKAAAVKSHCHRE